MSMWLEHEDIHEFVFSIDGRKVKVAPQFCEVNVTTEDGLTLITAERYSEQATGIEDAIARGIFIEVEEGVT